VPEIDKVSFCVPSVVHQPNWNKFEQLIQMLVQIESNRNWEDYEVEDKGSQVTFTYKGK
jgi:hypothetical protein